MTKQPVLKGILLGVATAIVSTAVGLLLLLSSDALYRRDVEELNIAAESGYSEEVIFRNYNAVTKYLIPMNNYDFDLPDLPYSEQGAQHFADTKQLMNGFFIAGAAALAASLLICAGKKSGGFGRVFKVGGIAALCFPVSLLAAADVDFDKFFILFHKVFFSNDYWLFDYRTDPIILILPEEYFMHCAMFIAFCWVVGAVVLFSLSAKKKSSSAQ